MIRAGMEAYEYLEKLKDYGDDAFARSIVEPRFQAPGQSSGFDPYDANVARPSDLANARQTLGDRIVSDKCAKDPGVLNTPKFVTNKIWEGHATIPSSSPRPAARTRPSISRARDAVCGWAGLALDLDPVASTIFDSAAYWPFRPVDATSAWSGSPASGRRRHGPAPHQKSCSPTASLGAIGQPIEALRAVVGRPRAPGQAPASASGGRRSRAPGPTRGDPRAERAHTQCACELSAAKRPVSHRTLRANHGALV